MSRLKINALNGSSDGDDGGDRVADKGESQRKCAASRPWVGIRRRLDAWKMHWAEVNYLYLLFVLFSLIKFFVRFFFVLPVLSISLFFVFFFGGFELRMQKCNMPQCNGDTKVQHQPLTAAVEWVCLRSCRDVQQQRWLCSLFFIFCIFFYIFYFTCGICIATANGRATLMGGMSVDYACQKRGKRLSRNALRRICCLAASRQVRTDWRCHAGKLRLFLVAIANCHTLLLLWLLATEMLYSRQPKHATPHQQCEGWVIWLLFFIYFVCSRFLFIPLFKWVFAFVLLKNC